MTMRLLICLVLVGSLSTSPALASNTTPASNYAWHMQPYYFDLGARPEAYATLLNQGYTVSLWSNTSAPEGEPNPTISVVLDEYSNCAGAGFMNSHGSELGHAVEVYPYTTQGLARRNAAFNAYNNPTLLYKAFVLGAGYHISIRYSQFPTVTSLAVNGVVHNQCCFGDCANGLWKDANGGQIDSYGPHEDCTIPDSITNTRILWTNFDGQHGSALRLTAVAHTGCPNLVRNPSGPGNVVLAPAVSGFSHSSGSQVPLSGLEVKWDFDTPVNTNTPALSAVSGTGILQVQYAWWNGDTRLVANVIPTGTGEGRVEALGTIASANCAQLFLEGGDGYSVRLIHGDDPAASVSGFGVVDGIAEWDVQSEFQTANYVVEGAASQNGPWTPVGTLVPPGSGRRQLPVGGFACYRLIEEETSGNRIVHSYAADGPRLPVPPEELPTVEFLQDQLDLLAQARSGNPPDNPRLQGERCVFFTVGTLVPTVQTNVANYWRDVWGVDAVVVSVDPYPDNPTLFRQTLKNAIRAEAIAGTKFFHLIGDGNDCEEFDGPLTPQLWTGSGTWEPIRQGYFASGYPHGGQPSRNLIPAFSIPDTLPRNQGTAWFTPYLFSDLPYQDTDDDGVPNVVVTRWPVTTQTDVLALAYKMQLYNDVGVTGGPYSVAFLTGDLDHDGVGDGALALAASQMAENALPSGQTISRLRESSVPNNALRNTAAANLWNNALSELVVLLSSWSNRSWPCNFFDQTNPNNPFHMGMLHSYANHFPLVIAASCDGADFPRTEDPDYGSPIAEKFLVAWNKGANGWIGPGSGTWHNANGPITTYTIEELFSDPERPMAESWFIAMRRVWQDHADEAEVLRTASAYVYLGDPLSSFRRVSNPIGIQAGGPPRYVLGLAQNAPNPFNPSTHIAFTTARKGTVRLAVYDIRGVHVATLVNGELPVGFHAVDWYGKGDDGNGVASGAYFYSLSGEGKTLTHKMLLLK